MKNILVFIISMLLLTACLDEADCVREAHGEIEFAFKKVSDGKGRIVLIDSLIIAGVESVLYDSVSDTEFIIPLDPLSHETSVFLYSNFGDDTIVLKYNTLTRLISPNCGAETFILDLEVKEHTFDSLKVVNLNVSADAGTNFEIYY